MKHPRGGGGVSLFLHAPAQYVGDLGNGQEGVGVQLCDDGLQAADLKTVHHEIDDGPVGAGIVAFGADVGDAPAEGPGQRLTDLVGPAGDDHGGFGLVQALHDEVHGPDGCAIGDDGVQGQDPAVEHAADHDV